MLKTIVVAILVAVAGLTGVTAATAATEMCATGWMMGPEGEGFESGDMLGSGWCTEGPMSSGVDPAGIYSRTGSYNAYLQTGTPQWNALIRHVGVPTDPGYCITVTGWVRTEGSVKDGRVGVRVGRTTAVVTEKRFGVSYGTYTPFEPVKFRGRAGMTEITFYLGYFSPSGFSRVMADDLLVTAVYMPAPAACA